MSIYTKDESPVELVALTPEGNYIDTYKSIGEAARKLNVSSGSIVNFMTGHSILVAKKYIFVKKEKYDPAVKVTYASLKRKKEFLKQKK